MTRWLATLAGDAADQDRLVELPDGDDWQVVHHERHGIVLCGDRFERLSDDGSLRREAEALIKHLNYAVRYRFADFQDVTLGATIEQKQGGDLVALHVHDTLHLHVAAKATVQTHVHLDAAIADPPARPNTLDPGADSARLVRLQEAHPDLADAFRYLEHEPDLRGYYKVGEATLRALGKPKKWDTLVGLGWTTDDELWRFTKSTHERRHHAVTGPEKPMTDSEARTYVRSLLDRLIAYLDRMTP